MNSSFFINSPFSHFYFILPLNHLITFTHPFISHHIYTSPTNTLIHNPSNHTTLHTTHSSNSSTLTTSHHSQWLSTTHPHLVHNAFSSLLIYIPPKSLNTYHPFIITHSLSILLFPFPLHYLLLFLYPFLIKSS